MRNVGIRHIEYVHFCMQCCDPSYRIHVFFYVLGDPSCRIHVVFCVLADPSDRIHVFSCVLGDPSYRIHMFFCGLGDPSYRIHVFSCVLGVWTAQSISLKKALFGHLLGQEWPENGQDGLFLKIFPHVPADGFFSRNLPCRPGAPKQPLDAFLSCSCASAV